MKKYIIALFLFISLAPVKAQMYFYPVIYSFYVDSIDNTFQSNSSPDSLVSYIRRGIGMENTVISHIDNLQYFSIDFIRINPDNDTFYIRIKNYSSQKIHMMVHMLPRASVQFHKVEAQYDKDIMSISPDPEAWKNVRKGDDYIFFATPKAGHEYDSIVVVVNDPDKCGTIFVDQTTKRCEIKNVQGDLDMEVTFIPTHKITIPEITSGSGATIINRNPLGRVEKGKDFTFTVDRNDDTDNILVTTNLVGYEDKIDINQLTGECTIRGVQNDLTVTVTLIPTYEISIPSVEGGSGALIINRNPLGRVEEGKNFTFTVKRNNTTDSILVTTNPVGYEDKIDINQLTEKCTIRDVQNDLTVNVKLIPTYEITIPPITSGSGATIDPDPWGRAGKGNDFTFTVDRNDDTDSILVTTNPVGYEDKIDINQQSGECTIRDVQSDLTVNVTLIPTHEITFSPITGATIDPASWGRVVNGDDFIFTVNRNAGNENISIVVTVDKPAKCGTLSVNQITGVCTIPNIEDDLVVTVALSYPFVQDAELRKWIANHKQAFTDYGVKVENDGTIIFTPANQAALAAMTSLEITDSEAMQAIDTSPGGPLPQSDYTITTIDDLLAYMPNLEHLDCSGNQLTSLDLSANEKLEMLDCTDNKLTYVDISETNLKNPGAFSGLDQEKPFVMRVTHRQYRVLRGSFEKQYPSWTEFILTDDNEEPEYVVPVINRRVILNACEGLTITTPTGVHFVNSGNSFSFKYYVKDGYNADGIKITTSLQQYDNNVRITPESDGGIRVIIYAIRHEIEIYITGVVPTNSVNNPFVDDENPTVWSFGQRLYVRTPYTTGVMVYDTKGGLHKMVQVAAGQQSFVLPPGIYIIRFDGNRTQKVVIR